MKPDWMEDCPRQPAGDSSKVVPDWMAERSRNPREAVVAMHRNLSRGLLCALIIAVIAGVAAGWYLVPVIRAWKELQRVTIDGGLPKVSGASPGKIEWTTRDSTLLNLIYRVACGKLDSLKGPYTISRESSSPTISDQQLHFERTILETGAGHIVVNLSRDPHNPVVKLSVSPGSYSGGGRYP